NAIPNKNTVITNVAKKAGRTMSRYVASTSHNCKTITRTLLASARNSATTVAPALVGFPNPSTNAETTHAERFTTPPSTADTAPCTPAQIPAMAATANVASACHFKTYRIGLVDSGGSIPRNLRDHCRAGEKQTRGF